MGNSSDSESNKKEDNNYITFETVQESINLSNPKLFKKYLHEVFLDLSSPPDTKNNKYISRLTFYEYLKLPIYISDKLFNSFKKHCKSGIIETEFVNGFYNLYMGTFEETTKIIFNLLDFDKDSKIEKEDVKLILIYLLLDDFNKMSYFDDNENQKEEDEIYKKQMKKLIEIDELINKTFKKKSMNLEEFINCLKNNKSDVYLEILCFLYSKKPFNEKSVECLKSKYMNDEEYKEMSKIYIKGKKFSKNLILSPTKNNNEIINKVINKKFNASIKSNEKSINEKDYQLAKYQSIPIKKHNKNVTNNIKSYDFLDDKKIHNSKKDKNDLINSNLIKNNDNIYYENYIYKISETNKITKFYILLINKDIFYYKTNDKKELIGMHNLSSCLIEEYENKGEKIIDNITYYSFSIIFKSNSKTRKYFTSDIEIYHKFIAYIKLAIDYRNFEEYYEIQKEIGVGSYSHVNLGIHKKTGKLVAIKVVAKNNERKNEEELVINEIDILKFCHHKNITQLIDYFETKDNIIIILKYIEGSTLGEYLKEINFNLDETKAANIMIQIAKGVKYLNKFGVVHRDLKPENIMITIMNSEIKVVIMDFGLSKIVSNEEKLNEGFGTLYYAAPELIQNLPYNKEIDIWSLGIILFYIFTSCYPFMGKEEDEIEEKIINDPVEFKDGEWEKISNVVQDLIKRCLEKFPEDRISIDDFINHPWFKNCLN